MNSAINFVIGDESWAIASFEARSLSFSRTGKWIFHSVGLADRAAEAEFPVLQSGGLWLVKNTKLHLRVPRSYKSCIATGNHYPGRFNPAIPLLSDSHSSCTVVVFPASNSYPLDVQGRCTGHLSPVADHLHPPMSLHPCSVWASY